MNCRQLNLLLIALCGLPWIPPLSLVGAEKKEKEPEAIQALLVTGGCSHDYATRKRIIVQGIRERVKRKIEWRIVHEGDGESDVRIPLFEADKWAEGYDIVVHDHCFPRVKDSAYVDRVLDPHRAGLPAVLLHGSMMSFRTGDERWFDFCGVTSRSHDRDGPVVVETISESGGLLNGVLSKESPWSIPREELYRIEKVVSGATQLTHSSDRDGKFHLNSWTHTYGGKSRIFGTTLGNEVKTFASPTYLDLIARGFLWALCELSDENYVAVRAEDSLKGMSLTFPEEPLPRPGTNDARWGRASALSSGHGNDPERAIDGDPDTYWEGGVPGPSSWQVDLNAGAMVGAIVLMWKGDAPSRYLVEGSTDLRSWVMLEEAGESSSEAAVFIHETAPVSVKQVRITIPATSPGEVPGIRECALYPSVDAVPSGLLLAPGAVIPAPPEFHTVGANGLERRLRLDPRWTIAERLELSVLGSGVLHPVQIVPAAFGGCYMLVRREANGDADQSHFVVRLNIEADGSISRTMFLDSVSPNSTITWDGEWIYVLHDGVLTAFRDTDRDGRADERFKAGRVFSLKPDNSDSGPDFSNLRLGDDGWLYARINGTRDQLVLRSGGGEISLPSGGEVRFRRNGRDLSVCSDPQPKSASSVVAFDGALVAAEDGRSLWIAVNEAEGGGGMVVRLDKTPNAPLVRVDWDRIDSADLFNYLDSDRPSIRREAIEEILRRHRNPVPDLERLLGRSPSPDLADSLIHALFTRDEKRCLSYLVALTGSPEPALQKLAFRRIGDHPNAKNHPVFQELTRIAVPDVTAAILEAIVQSGTERNGLNDLVLGLAAHSDPHLSRVARKFLITREASFAAFEAIGDPSRSREWPGAFEVLAALHRVRVAEGLVFRLERTGSPIIRKLGIDSLCRLYFRDREAGEEWEGTRIIEEFLRLSLLDHRVDRPALLDALATNGIPLPDPGTLVTLAKENLSLEPLAIEALRSIPGQRSDGELVWLSEMNKSDSRDAILREQAGNLLEAAEHSENEGGPGKTGEEPATQQSETGVGDLPLEEIPARVEAESPSLTDGRDLFRSLNCGRCHNIHGEGPSLGPDLASVGGKLDLADWVEAILRPDQRISHEFETQRIELHSRRVLRVMIEDQDESRIMARDRAGNALEIPSAQIRLQWSDSGSLMDVPKIRDLSVRDFASLVAFLRELEN